MMRSQLHFKGNFFCKELGELLAKEPKLLGIQGLTTMVGIATEIERVNHNPFVVRKNTRTFPVLTVAEVLRNHWHVTDNTGNPLHEKLLGEQLLRNKLTKEGISTVRRSGGTNNGK